MGSAGDSSLLLSNIVDSSLRPCPAGQLAGPLIGYLYASSGSKNCQSFGILLKRFVKELNADGLKLQVVYVSADTHPKAFEATLKARNWFGYEFGPHEKLIAHFEKQFQFDREKFPQMLVIESTTGNLVTRHAVEYISGEGTYRLLEFPWRPNLEIALRKMYTKGMACENFAIYFADKDSKSLNFALASLSKALGPLKLRVFLVPMDQRIYVLKQWLDVLDVEWAFISPEDLERKFMLIDAFSAPRHPKLVITDKDLNVVNPDAAEDLGKDVEGKYFPWVSEEWLNLRTTLESSLSQTPGKRNTFSRLSSG
jgi:hypothetical protein